MRRAFDVVGSRGAGLWLLGLASTNAMSTRLGPPTSLRRRLSEGTNGFNLLNAALASNNLGGRVRSATHTQPHCTSAHHSDLRHLRRTRRAGSELRRRTRAALLCAPPTANHSPPSRRVLQTIGYTYYGSSPARRLLPAWVTAPLLPLHHPPTPLPPPANTPATHPSPTLLWHAAGIGQADGRSLDLVITNTSEYTPNVR